MSVDDILTKVLADMPEDLKRGIIEETKMRKETLDRIVRPKTPKRAVDLVMPLELSTGIHFADAFEFFDAHDAARAMHTGLGEESIRSAARWTPYKAVITGHEMYPILKEGS